MASPRDSRQSARAESREAEDDLQAELRKPWRGQADKLKPAQKDVLACFEEQGVTKNVMDDGVMVKKAATKYWNKWDGPGAAKTTERLNITRLLGEVLESRLTPLETKLKVAEASNKTACAKAFLKRHRVETHVPATDQPEVDALQAKAKAAKTGGDAHAKEDKRQQLMTEFARRETPLPDEQLQLALYQLTVMVIMCHLAFSFTTSFYFRQFLKVIRPNFEKKLGGEKFRERVAGPLLDEVYEEAVEIAEEKLSRATGKITLGIDGHKDGNGRSLETITRAKLGVSVFGGCEYMKTERATGDRLAKTVQSYIVNAALYIAVVADNTGNNVTMAEKLALVEALKHLFFLGCFIHVMDLLVEDIAKLKPFADLQRDAHFAISFIKKHAILYEEFLDTKRRYSMGPKCPLTPLPAAKPMEGGGSESRALLLARSAARSLPAVCALQARHSSRLTPVPSNAFRLPVPYAPFSLQVHLGRTCHERVGRLRTLQGAGEEARWRGEQEGASKV